MLASGVSSPAFQSHEGDSSVMSTVKWVLAGIGAGWRGGTGVREVFLPEEVQSEWSVRANRSCTGKEGESEGSSEPERVSSVCKGWMCGGPDAFRKLQLLAWCDGGGRALCSGETSWGRGQRQGLGPMLRSWILP